jgi:hypothetical protein
LILSPPQNLYRCFFSTSDRAAFYTLTAKPGPGRHTFALFGNGELPKVAEARLLIKAFQYPADV